MGALSIAGLSKWGFADQNKDGKITSDEIPTYRNIKFQSDQFKAFTNLAQMAGDKTAIDQADLDLIQRDPNALSQVMGNDPEYRGDLIGRASLEEGKREVKSDHRGDVRDGIPPVAYNRLVSFAQMALNFKGARLSVSGVYSPETSRAVAVFQSRMGLTGRDGSFIDRSTFGSLVLASRFSPSVLKESIASIRLWLLKQTPSAFLLDNYQDKHSDYVDLIISTLQYLYPEDVPSWKTEARLAEANVCLERRMGGAWVGPKTLAALIEELDKRIPKK